jgi:hypothetical protein
LELVLQSAWEWASASPTELGSVKDLAKATVMVLVLAWEWPWELGLALV